jgi:hypothetical protein
VVISGISGAALPAAYPQVTRHYPPLPAVTRRYPPHIRRALDSAPFASLRQEATLSFDPGRYPLQTAFVNLLGLPPR